MGTRPPGGESAEAPLSDWTRSTEGRAAATPPPEAGFTPGTMLAGRYRIVAPLGRGGMGEVYRADDTKLGQPVALKFVRGTLSADLLERLYAEVRIGRQVSHPSVCRLYDVVEFEGQTCLAMEYVDGEDLSSLLARIGRLPADKALDIARDVCAGLAAVHDKGVVHRDLKPANVMVDGRGRARLTDFGLAVALEAPGQFAFAGTPAYMSPEQLAGAEVTFRSDLYALGLILYEMLTGRRFFDARTHEELLAQHREAKAPKLQSAARQLDASLDRAVQQCLEEDARARPASARAVLTLLPGADPLEAAVAAGETPSPEIVAAAGKVGDLRPAVAWMGLAVVLGSLALAAHLYDRTLLLHRDIVPKPPEVLAERAREILARVTPGATPVDSAWSFEWDRAHLDHVRGRANSGDAWPSLGQDPLSPIRFFYRESPRRLVAANRDGMVRRDDPPADVSGMTEVVVDARGRLESFLAVPPQVETAKGPWPDPDWTPLFADAGLDSAALRPAPPQWAAPVDSDRKAAWEGAYPGPSPLPVRIEAAAYHGRPVWFAVLPPWSKAARMVESRAPASPTPVGDASVWILALAMPIGGAVLARRNLRLGRGDRKGAFRIALFVFAAYGLARLFRADHVAAFGDELWILIKVLAYPSFWAAQVWLLYVALEPYARRRWPHVLISWKRLLSGNLRDPLVGRDVLLGSVAGSLLIVVFLAVALLPGWLGRAPVPPGPFLYGETLNSLRQVLFRFFVNQFSAVLFALVFLFVLALLRMLLRSHWLAGLAWCALIAGPIAGEDPVYGWISGVARALLLLLVLTRGGLLPLAVALFVMFSTIESVLTLDVTAWYAVRGLPVVLALAGLAVYGFYTSLGGKSLFGGALDED